MNRRDLLNKIYWTVAFLGFFLVAFAVSVAFLNPTSVGSPDFIENVNLWAVIWAGNFVIVLVLSFILARDLIKLFFEYQARRPGSRIKGKLITTFVVFSMFPALIMSFLAYGLINRNLSLWFSSPSEQLIGSSDQIVSSFYEQNRAYSMLAARTLATTLEREGVAPTPAFERAFRRSGLRAARVYGPNGLEVFAAGEWLGEDQLGTAALASVYSGADYYGRRRLLELRRADTDVAVVAVPVQTATGALGGAVVAQMAVPKSAEFHAIQVDQARQKHQELKASVRQVEVNYFSILVLTTLSVIFGFVWLGTYIARKITVPLEALAEGAGQLAEGNFDHRVDVKAADELGILVDSFNRMAEEIKQSRLELERANSELKSTNAELEERRRYTETILQNIATGVVSVDEEDTICTVNEAALTMLQTTRERILNRSIAQVADEDLRAEFEGLKKKVALYGSFRKNIAFKRGDQQLFIAATATVNPLPLRDKAEYLIVLDDLTELIRAEKFAAWQEVARRLAHEIKNPLTPIQLSAERIQKRFERIRRSDSPELEEFGRILGDAVRVIGAEAEMLKTLVNEFSRFARLPISKPSPADLHQLIDQTLALYGGALGSVDVVRQYDDRIRRVRVDPEQMRRVFINLIDNSLDALSECREERQLVIETRLNPNRGSVRIEFRDNGHGIAPEDYENLFLPYFSTKKKGTGLGLAIVRQIVSEHNGYIRAEPVIPRGTRFTMDIPAR